MEPEDKFLWRYHLIRELQVRWKRRGHRVAIQPGTDALPAADLAILHVDRSVTPPAYLAAMQRYPRSVNAAVGDIRKRSFSTLLLQRPDEYAGPVIVKTDLNSGGRPEMVKWKGARRLGRDPGPPVRAHNGDYRIYASLRAVPAQVWADPALVVEKLVPEPGPEGFCLRCWYFLGDAEFNLLLHSQKAYVKGEACKRAEEAPVPEPLRALRRRLGFDYGKFDYVLRDGVPQILDVNRTPAFNLLERFGLLATLAERLERGVEALLAS